MPRFEITDPTGKRFEINAPEGASQDEALAYAQAQFASKKPYVRPPDALDNPNMATEGMSGTQKFLAGYGGAFPKLMQGAKQVFGIGDQDKLQQEIDETKRLDAPLNKTGAGLAGNIAGNVAAAIPAAFIPGANTYLGATAGGMAMGALSPVSDNSERLTNTLIGGAAGAGGQAIGRGIAKVIQPITSRLGPEEQALATAAEREGIPLTAADKTGSRGLKLAESVMEDMPLTSGPQLAAREAQQRAFTAAALRRTGITSESADAGTLLAQKGALGKQIGDIAEKGTLDFNKGLTNDLAQIAGEAGRRGKAASESVTSLIDNILAEVDQAGVMTGQNYQAWRQALQPLAKAGGPDGHHYAQIRQALDTAFNDQMGATGSQAWKQANREYSNLKTVMDAMGGAGNLPAKGQVAPAQLAAALTRSVGKEGRALGRGDLNELSRVGQLFVRDQVPNSGTAQRQLIQSLMTGGGGGAFIGGAGAAATGNDPVKGALTGAAFGVGGGAAKLALPRLIQSLMNSPTGQAYLTNNALTPAARARLVNAMRSISIGATPALVPSE